MTHVIHYSGHSIPQVIHTSIHRPNSYGHMAMAYLDAADIVMAVRHDAGAAHFAFFPALFFGGTFLVAGLRVLRCRDEAVT